MQHNILFDVIAAGSCHSDGTANVARGLAFATTGAGVYTATLDTDMGAADCVAFATIRNTTNMAYSITHTSNAPTVLTINTWKTDTKVATNCDFDLMVARIASGASR